MSRPADLRRAAVLAARVLLTRQVCRLPVDPLSILRACRDTRVYSDRAAAEALNLPQAQLGEALRSCDAVTWRILQGETMHYIVVYRIDGNPARMRFTLAHELGHRLLGHTGDDPAEEQEADCFASHLLCPQPMVDAALAVGADAAGKLAVACYVSRSCARVALRRERLPLPADIEASLRDLLAQDAEDLKCRRPKGE